MGEFKKAFQEILRYPSAIIGLITVFLFTSLAIYAMIAIPYSKAIELWRGGEEVWYQNPKYAAPLWVNYFSREKQPVSFILNDSDAAMQKEVIKGEQATSRINITYTFDFPYDSFPQDIILYFTATYKEKQPFVSIYWLTPDGRKIRISDFGVDPNQTFRISQDEKLKRRLGDLDPMVGLFVSEGGSTPLKGQYQLLLEGVAFEEGSDLTAEMVLHGTLAGMFGTDHQRRDLVVPMLWGAPVALAFGLIASLGTSVLTMIIAATGAWYGGWVDELIQRITEVNLVLPFFSILVMVGVFYSRSTWVILSVTVLLSIFTGSIKVLRSTFIQIKESPYIEAARAYGTSDMRIIFNYMIPRMIPLLIPGIVSSVPAFVFLEATLAVLGLGDPVLPTWGRMIQEAESHGALYKGYYYWILEPAVLLMTSGLGFAMLGFALDRIFNPKLRDL
jgi:peptide/nickel transport system permease protein